MKIQREILKISRNQNGWREMVPENCARNSSKSIPESLMKRILILTASFGDGHNAAARSLRDAIELVDPNAEVELIDLFETYGALNTLLKQAYQGMVRYAPFLWSGVFSIFDNASLFSRQMNMMGKLRNELASLINRFDPQVIVSTYPVYSHLIAQLDRQRRASGFRLITVVTDSISV